MVERLVQQQTINSLQDLVAYFLSQIGRLEEIMAGGTPSEEDLTIGWCRFEIAQELKYGPVLLVAQTTFLLKLLLMT